MIRGDLWWRSQRLVAERLPFVLATVVRARHPTSVHAGDAALVHADGTIEGFVGGVCAETSVRLHALRVMETGEPILLRILPVDEAGEPPALEGAVTVRNDCLSGGGLEIFLEPQLPAPALLVHGETPVAEALAHLARALGYVVMGAAEGEPAGSVPDLVAVVVASHGRDEEDVLARALSDGVPYVGLVASRMRGAAVRDALDVSPALRAQLHTPAGLDIGALTPSEVALSILAEIVAEARDGRGGRPPGAVAEAGAGAESGAGASGLAVDPVCGMEVAVTAASVSLEWDGGRVYFCSGGCRDTFAAEHAGVR